ncbi:hypothetical protein HN51_034217 [Arachis hypogaea]|uniref:HMA domain-containing protein n=2 Tax=Arachis TaxID=3817 RepID=A0A445A9F7_ARAHY|nr:uncharacterized protein DS421_13g394460 [Arachis hypogaea]RYR22952.1 hypothetical protein Ahy_B03g068236 [Arachis hypogaea]
MENNESVSPTCVVLKVVNLQCCEACPSRVNKELRKIKGVTDVQMNREEGLVTVFGEADSSKLIKAVKKVGRKRAEIYMEPKDQPTEPSCTCLEHTKSTKSKNSSIPDDTKSTKSKHTKASAKHDDDDDDSDDNCSADADFGDHDLPLPPQFNDHGAPSRSNNHVASNASYHHYPQNNPIMLGTNNGGGGGGYFQGTTFPVPAYINTYARFCNDYNECVPPPMGYGRPQQPPYQYSYYHHQQRYPPQPQPQQQAPPPPPPPPCSYYGDANGCTIS